MLDLKKPAARAEWIYGQPMAPCPACGSYNMKPQMPVKIGLAGDDTAMQAFGKLARAMKSGPVVLEGFRPETKHKGYGFWHLISEAPDQRNRNEDDRIPDLRRCERVRWVAWCIQNAGTPGFSWWENERKGQTHVVIWAEEHDYAVMLGKRNTAEGVRFYLLKTAYCLRSHNVRRFAKERDVYWASKKD